MTFSEQNSENRDLFFLYSFVIDFSASVFQICGCFLVEELRLKKQSLWGEHPNMNSGLHLLKVESMGDVVGREEGGNQVGDGAGLTTVGTKLEGVQSSLPVEGQMVML